jgi:hypothetical protein
VLPLRVVQRQILERVRQPVCERQLSLHTAHDSALRAHAEGDWIE